MNSLCTILSLPVLAVAVFFVTSCNSAKTTNPAEGGLFGWSAHSTDGRRASRPLVGTAAGGVAGLAAGEAVSRKKTGASAPQRFSLEERTRLEPVQAGGADEQLSTTILKPSKTKRPDPLRVPDPKELGSPAATTPKDAADSAPTKEQ